MRRDILVEFQPCYKQKGSWNRKVGNVLFNDALNKFYLRLYGIRHMVKDHSDSKRGNPLPPHGLLFLIAARVLLYAPSHRQDITYHALYYTSHGALAGTKGSWNFKKMNTTITAHRFINHWLLGVKHLVHSVHS